MKPVIIYSLPRTRSTAILNSCKRETILHEPFDQHTLFEKDAPKAFHLYPYYSNSISTENWESIKDKMNNPNTASKFFGMSLYLYHPAREWFQEIDKNKTHDIFVAIRDRKELALSYILAHKFGWVKHSATKPYECIIEDRIFFYLALVYDSFLRFFPTNATLIEYESMPVSHFDRSLNTLEDQESHLKLKYVKNLDYCMEQIDSIIKCYDAEWNRKISTLKRL